MRMDARVSGEALSLTIPLLTVLSTFPVNLIAVVGETTAYSCGIVVVLSSLALRRPRLEPAPPVMVAMAVVTAAV